MSLSAILAKRNSNLSLGYGSLQLNSVPNVTNTLNVIGDANISGSMTCSDLNYTSSSVQSLHITGTEGSSSINSGSLVNDGGVGIAGTVNIGDNTYINGTLNILNTTPVGGTDLGALIVAGGLNIGKQALITGGMTVVGNTNLKNPVTISNTTVSTSITTGALTVTGGVGVSGDVYIGGKTSISSPIYSPKFIPPLRFDVVVFNGPWDNPITGKVWVQQYGKFVILSFPTIEGPGTVNAKITFIPPLGLYPIYEQKAAVPDCKDYYDTTAGAMLFTTSSYCDVHKGASQRFVEGGTSGFGAFTCMYFYDGAY